MSAIFAYFMTFTDSGILVSYKVMYYSVILYDYWDRDVWYFFTVLRVWNAG